MSARIWIMDDGCHGLYIYVGINTGLEFTRHAYCNAPGKWRVAVTGWTGMDSAAVVDDFGDLVQVKP